MKKVFKIEGLDCPNCAKEVEMHLNEDKRINKASIDFVNSKLFVEFNEELEMSELERKIAEKEDGVSLSEIKTNEKIEIVDKKTKAMIWRLVACAVITFVAMLIPTKTQAGKIVQICVYVLAYLIVSLPCIVKMFKNIFARRNIFDENLLMTVSTVGAFIIGSCFEGVMVMWLSQLGDILQDIAVNKSRKEIMKTLDIRPNTANKLLKNGEIVTVDPKDLSVGDKILVRMGERIPVDGVVIDGEATVDTSCLTGEFLPKLVGTGSEVFSGTMLSSNSITIEVKKKFENSTVNKILELFSTSGEHKSKAEKFITKFARWYTPVVLCIALVVGIVPPLFVGHWLDFVYRALIFLVISCPCAIIISVPLTYFTGLGLSAKNGIMIKGANYLDALYKTKKIVLDKTGTLTMGKFAVSKIDSKIDEQEFLRLLAYAESESNHPIAKSVVEYYGKEIDKSKISKKIEKAGSGVEIVLNGQQIVAGTAVWLKKHGVKVDICHEFGSVIYLSVDSTYCGYALLNDKIKDNSKQFIEEMKRKNISTIMLTGDTQESASNLATALGIDEFYAGLMPENKFDILQKIKQENNQTTVFVGDGVNDAPSIMSADVGIAMGAMGSDVAVESADVVIMNDDLKKVADSIKISVSTRRKSVFNIVFSLAVKAVVMVLSVLGITSMGMAVFADVGVMVIAILNSLLLFKKKLN